MATFTVIGVEDVVMTQAPASGPSARRGGRLLGGGLLAAAVAAVVALDTLPLPFSTPVAPVAPAVRAAAPAAATTTTPAEDPAAVARAAGVDATLAALTAQLRAGATGTGAELVVPGDGPLRKAVSRLVRNARAVPDSTTNLTRATYGPLSAGVDGVVATAVDVTTLLPAANPATATVDASFTQSGGRWLLSAWTPRSGTSKIPENPLLLAVDLVGVRTKHVTLLGSRSSGRLNPRLAQRLEAATSQVRPILGEQGWDGTVVVYAFTERPVLDQIMGDRGRGYRPVRDLQWWDASFPPNDARLVLGPGFVLRDDAVTRQGLRGAVSDRAAMASSDGSLPQWMRDAVVVYAETRTGTVVDGAEAIDARGLYDETWRGFRRRNWRPVLRVDVPDIDPPSAHETDSAFFAWHYVVDTKGEGTARRLWKEAASGGGTPADREKAALKTVLSTTPGAFRTAVRSYAARLVARAA